jgi:hypothetical protein
LFVERQSNRLAETLELLLQDKLTPAEFRTRHPIQETSDELGSILANVEHFLADADIRIRDRDYRAMQEAKMRELISSLRSGDVDTAGTISFLT